MKSRAGLVVRGDDGLYFIPATVAKALVATPEVSPVPGAGLGMALVSGEVVAVVPLGDAASALVLCDVDGELVAFSGLSPEASGFFEATEAGVSFAGELAQDLDLNAALRSVEISQQGERGALSDGPT
jgi:hypothetical protein